MRDRLLGGRHRLQRVEARPAYAGFPGRLALRGRHVAELRSALDRAERERSSRRSRYIQALRLRLEAFDLRRSIGRFQVRLSQADGRLRAEVIDRYHVAGGRLGAAAARLEAMSPLAVLGRGYAVCWDGARQVIIRDAAAVSPGDGVRVTLQKGEIRCVVAGRTGQAPQES